jgi:PAS domain-containing protein/two-component sensor histidine kinase
MGFRLSQFRKNESKTLFAPAERYDEQTVIKQNISIDGSDFLKKVLSEAPVMFMILNDKRQVIYANHNLTQILGYKKVEDALGLRPGEVFQCINAEIEPGGCGTSENCRYCGAVNAVIESDKTNNTITKELRITMSDDSGQSVPGDFEVISRPFFWNEQRHFLVLLNNIENSKKKEQLERVFFHDIVNKAGSLAGLMEIINNKEIPPESANLVNMVARGMKELLDDILFQKQIQAAERGEVNLNKEAINAEQFLENLKDDFFATVEKKKIQIQINIQSGEKIFISDKVILNRILTNLLKNAFEASSENDIIKLEFTFDDNKPLFIVNNPAVMTNEVKSQVFQRSFSTKGAGRGLGTYSIKLFTEKYLKGKAWFESVKKQGTSFFIELPGS